VRFHNLLFYSIMAGTFKFEIITPDGIVFQGEVESVQAPGTYGSFGVLVDHAPFMTTTTVGKVEVVAEEKGGDKVVARRRHFASSGGFIEVLHNSVTLLAETCEAAENIDIERAKAALKRAQERLKSRGPDLDILRAEFAMKRALNRIKIATSSEMVHQH
jgi:F-type H+-transporting ATPase subunit epsilon